MNPNNVCMGSGSVLTGSSSLHESGSNKSFILVLRKLANTRHNEKI